MVPNMHVWLAAAAWLALTACSGTVVKIPAADTTPPLSSLRVAVQGKEMVLLPGEKPQSVELGRADSLVLIASGEDQDGGVMELALLGNVVAACGDPATTKATAAKPGTFLRRYFHPGKPGLRVPGTRTTRYVLRGSDFHELCGPQPFYGLNGAAGVRAVNYHGISVTSPTLEFHIEGEPRRPQAKTSRVSK